MVSKPEQGQRVWFFPDGDIPPAGNSQVDLMHGHESLILLNPNAEDATVHITVYYEDAQPRTLGPMTVAGERVRCIRTNEPIDGYQISTGQYALRIESSVGLVCQIGRADVRQNNLSYYTTMGYAG